MLKMLKMLMMSAVQPFSAAICWICLTNNCPNFHALLEVSTMTTLLSASFAQANSPVDETQSNQLSF
jgi:hypothetical protein